MYTSFFENVTPESQGISSLAIRNFMERLRRENRHTHGLVMLRGGKCVAEAYPKPYVRGQAHQLFSCSKTFTATAVGLAVEKGLLCVEDLVSKYTFLLEKPEGGYKNPSPFKDRMKLKHLLSMTTGQKTEPQVDEKSVWAEMFLDEPVEFEPGTEFMYNSLATYMLSAVVQEVTGKTVLELLNEEVFSKLGIEGATWEKSPQGICSGGWGLSLSTLQLARFGQCLLRKGKSETGETVIPEGWVADMTHCRHRHSKGGTNDWTSGYGYQCWMNSFGGYRADGAFGQFIVVLPEIDFVMAMNSGENDMGAILTALNETVVQGIQNAKDPSAQVPESPECYEALQKEIGVWTEDGFIKPRQDFQIPLADVSKDAKKAVDGKVFVFEKNSMDLQKVSVKSGDSFTVAFDLEQIKFDISFCGCGGWKEQAINFWWENTKVAARAFSNGRDFHIELAFIDGPVFIDAMIINGESPVMQLNAGPMFSGDAAVIGKLA